MKQLTQKLGSGEMRIQEVPLPVAGPGQMVVRNHYSLISAGTEGSTVRAARKNLIGKAKERPQQVKQVIDSIRRVGPVQTYRSVTNRLNAYSSLGYSSAGEVVTVAPDVTGFRPGDRVACAGNTASHAEVVTVSVNLCVRLPEPVDLKSACYNTLGAIALQGIRQADLRLGEACVVIGLGLLGQLTCLLLRASGVVALGIDVDNTATKIARQFAADDAWTRDDLAAPERVLTYTRGLGADAVIITAATDSLDPINFAGQLAREKGRVVVVGDVPTGFDREPYYYRKELELRMSCSYGPGRYDIDYEELGRDYPAAYVRWTENRNMQAFQQLVHSGKVDLGYLTTHEFSLEDATDAYQLILDRSEPFLGIVLKYDTTGPLERQPVPVRDVRAAGTLGIGFVGAGNYAQNSLLPHLSQDDPDLVLRSVLTRSGTTSKRVAERFGFEHCDSDFEAMLSRPELNTLFIATRNDTHASYVTRSIETGKHVFVEKPLAIRSDELTTIEDTLLNAGSPPPLLMVGFNRRFSPLAVLLKQQLSDTPMAMVFRVNAGTIAADSWIQHPEIGGGRIIGEACHFIDLMCFLCGSVPVRVHAAAMDEPLNLRDTVTISLEFANGSVGTVAYFANGAKAVPKEYLEVFQSGVTAQLTDFRRLEVFGPKRTLRKKQLQQDKGQVNMLARFLEAAKAGGPPPISIGELIATTRATFAADASIKTRKVVEVGPSGIPCPVSPKIEH